MLSAEDARASIAEGRRLRAAGDRMASLKAFKEAAQNDPSNATAIIECAYDYLDLKHIPEARAGFEQGLELEPNNKAALIGLGHTFRHLRELDSAEQAFRRVLALEPTHGGANTGLGYTLKSLNRREEALHAFQAAATASPVNTSLRVEVANLLRELGRADEAIAALREAADQEPSNTAQLASLGRLLKQTGRNAEATEIFRKLVATNPDNSTFAIELGHLLREIDARDEANQILTEVLRREPENTSAWIALGWLHRKTKQVDLAADAFQNVVRLQPTNVGALHALGLAERERGNHDAALHSFDLARQTDPNAQYIRLEICNSLQKLHRFDEAIAEYGKLLERWPATRDAHLGLGYVLRSCGRIEQALAAFEEAARDDPAHPNGLIEAGHLLLRLGRPVEAEQSFRSALDRSPANASALVGLSYALRRLGSMEEAETALRTVLQQQASNNGARVALAHLLEAQYRLDEAADLFSEVIATDPNHADSLAAMGNISRRRGDRGQALDFFRKAAVADATNKARLIDVAVELRDLGQVDESASILDDVLAQLPGEPRALMQRGQLLRRQDRRAEALAVFCELQQLDPANAQAMVEAATEEKALGHPAAAKEWLEKALATETDHLGALLALAELAMQEEYLESALAHYKRAADAHPTNTWAWLGGARALFELGRRDEACGVISDVRNRLGPHPEIAGIEIEFLRNQRSWSRAQEILDDVLPQSPRPNFWLWSHKVQISIITGQYAEASASLQNTPASSVVDQARVALLSGQLAEAQFQYKPAIAHYREAIRLNPGDAWAHFELSRAALMNLDVHSSRAALSKFVEVSRSSLLLKRQSLSPSQNHVGQLIDEFVLDAEAFAALRRIRLRPLESQFEPLRRLIREHPDYTPAAIIAAIALRQHGELAPRGPTTNVASSLIPRTIFQFWDDDPPEDVQHLMASWRQLNPGHSWTCFNDESAEAFLEEEFGREVLRAYQLAPVPAQKADIFRLACLVARGGVYADADDRCLAPIDSFLRPDATLAVHQENYGSIGNNFIAATPEHPVLVRALKLAAAAMHRGDHDLVWLSTGPGLLTRAFALEWAAGRPGGVLRRTQLMDLGELQRVIGIHCPVRYKSTHRHWSRAAFGRAKRGA
jgi:tetratricopeptide (TPR) repeat protein